MKRVMFAIAIAAIVFVAVDGTSKAAPIAPLSGVTANTGNVVQAHYYHHHHYPYYHHHHYYHHRYWHHHHWHY